MLNAYADERPPRVEPHGTNHEFSRLFIHRTGRVVGRREGYLKGSELFPCPPILAFNEKNADKW